MINERRARVERTSLSQTTRRDATSGRILGKRRGFPFVFSTLALSIATIPKHPDSAVAIFTEKRGIPLVSPARDENRGRVSRLFSRCMYAYPFRYIHLRVPPLRLSARTSSSVNIRRSARVSTFSPPASRRQRRRRTQDIKQFIHEEAPYT